MTGNRRFLNIRCNGGAAKHPWDLTAERQTQSGSRRLFLKWLEEGRGSRLRALREAACLQESGQYIIKSLAHGVISAEDIPEHIADREDSRDREDNSGDNHHA